MKPRESTRARWKVARWWFLALAAATAAAAAACAAETQTVRPDEASAAQHRQEAARERTIADNLQAKVVPATGGLPNPYRDPITREPDPFYGPTIYDPTEGYLDAVNRHREHARQHLAAARALEAFEQVQCRDFPPAARAACPLLGAVGGEPPHRGAHHLRARGSHRRDRRAHAMSPGLCAGRRIPGAEHVPAVHPRRGDRAGGFHAVGGHHLLRSRHRSAGPEGGQGRGRPRRGHQRQVIARPGGTGRAVEPTFPSHSIRSAPAEKRKEKRHADIIHASRGISGEGQDRPA